MSDPIVGQTLDRRYALRREIARGGAAIVFEARHEYTGRAVALKLLHGDRLRERVIRERLILEAKLLGVARHPGVVQVLDAGVTDDLGPFIAMELLEGRPLDGVLLARNRLPVADAVHIARQICEAMSFVHGHSIVHRDLKPANVLVTKGEVGEEVVKVFDFGVASIARAGPDLSVPGEIIGTPEYMAPEQLLAADRADRRCDVYGTAAILFECLAGHAPFEGSYAELLVKHAAGKVPSVRDARPEVDEGLDAVIARGLALDPAQRFPDASSFALALARATGLQSGRSALLGLGASRAPAMARRRFPRAPYVTPVRIHLSGDMVVDGRTEDISAGGMLVATERACAHDDHARVRFAMPMSGHVVTVGAVARWVQRGRRNLAAAGLEFVDLAPEIADEISAYANAMGAVEGA